jgi:hypothetical protein
MKTITRGLLASVVLVGAGIGLASPASAQLEPGSYTATSIGGMFGGIASPWVITSCGENCLTVLYQNGTTVDFRLQGNTWTGNDPECVRTIDNDSLTVRADCGDGGAGESRLTKNG